MQEKQLVKPLIGTMLLQKQEKIEYKGCSGEPTLTYFYPLLDLHFLNVDIIPPLFVSKYLLLFGLESDSFNISFDHDSINHLLYISKLTPKIVIFK